MTSRLGPYGLHFVLACLVVLTGATGIGLSACSSTETTSSGSPEAGSDAPADRTVVPIPVADAEPDDSGTETPAQCQARCEKAHPTAVAKYDAVDTCWSDHCKGPCVDENGIFPPDGGVDGGAEAGADGGLNDGGTDLCTSGYYSGVDRACDDCTETFCCAAWDGCYNNTECQEYNACVSDCP